MFLPGLRDWVDPAALEPPLSAFPCGNTAGDRFDLQFSLRFLFDIGLNQRSVVNSMDSGSLQASRLFSVLLIIVRYCKYCFQKLSFLRTSGGNHLTLDINYILLGQMKECD